MAPTWQRASGMSTNLPSRSQHADPEFMMIVNTAPLAGVVLSVLAAWIVAIPNPLHAISLDITGSCGGPLTAEPVVHTVVIDFDDTVSWDDQALPSRAALDARMQAVGALAPADQPEVHIKPHGQAGHGAVTEVIGSVQRNGVRKMGLIGSDFSVIQSRLGAAI